MNIKINGSNVKITEGMTVAINDKLNFLDKFLSESEEIKINVISVKNIIKVSAVLLYNNRVVKIEEKDSDFYTAVDKLTARLKSQISKLHSLKVKKVRDHDKALKYLPDNENVSIEPKIVKRKNSVLEEITEQEAIEIMELNGYDAYVFKNADDNGRVSMLHIRNDGDYFVVLCE